jgi:drug/metabolite transporter (DMT)-like permease
MLSNLVTRQLKGYLLGILAMFFWGLSFVWFKQVVNQYEPITIIFLRLTFSSVLIAIYLLVSASLQRIRRKDLKWFLLLAFSQPFCYFIGESFGLQLVSSTISSVIISTIPLFTPVAAFLLLKEKVTREILIGIIFSFFGILLMIMNPDLTLTASPRGVLLLFFAVTAAVAYTVIVRRLAHEYEPVTIILLQNTIGAAYFLPLFVFFDLRSFINIIPSREAILALIKLAFFASTFSYLFYIVSIREIGVVKSNILTNLIPIFTAIFSYFVLAESFTVAKLIGMVIVISGIVISQYKSIRLMPKRNGITSEKSESDTLKT